MKRFLAIGIIVLIIATGCAKPRSRDTSVGKKRAIEQAQIRYEADIDQAKSRYWDSVASLRGNHGLSNDQVDNALKAYYSTFKGDLRQAARRRYKTYYPLAIDGTFAVW